METIKTVAHRFTEILKTIWAKIQDEPVLVRTVLALLVSGGIIELTDGQLDQVNSIVLAIVMIVGAVSARGAVQPLPKEERQRLFRRRNRGDDESA